MDIKELYEIIDEFFIILNPNISNDYIEENDDSELWKLCEDFFEQMGPQI